MARLSSRVPSLLGLAYLEATVRNRSFTRAARELHVTQSAVSHQIRSLEDALGVQLLERGPQGALPTAAGARLARAIAEGFDRIESCLDLLLAPMAPSVEVIHLGAPPSLAHLWLIPRLAEFAREHPDMMLQPHANIQFDDFTTGEIAAALRYGRGGYGEVSSVHLAEERFVAVCAPSLVPAGADPERLSALPILQGWSPKSPRSEPPAITWIRAYGWEPRAPMVTFNRQMLAVAAAIAGQGLAIVPWQMVRDALAQGTLVAPTDFEIADELGYHLVWEPTRAPAGLARLQAWLRAAMA